MDQEKEDNLLYIYTGYTALLLVVVSLAVLLLALLVFLLRRVNRAVLTIEKAIGAEETTNTGVLHLSTKFLEEKSRTEEGEERVAIVPTIVVGENNEEKDGSDSEVATEVVLAEVEVNKSDQQEGSSSEESLNLSTPRAKEEDDEDVNAGEKLKSGQKVEDENKEKQEQEKDTQESIGLKSIESIFQDKGDREQNVNRSTGEKSTIDESLKTALPETKVATSGNMQSNKNTESTENTRAPENAETLKATEKKEDTKEDKLPGSIEATNSEDKEKHAIEKLKAENNTEEKNTSSLELGKRGSADMASEDKSETKV